MNVPERIGQLRAESELSRRDPALHERRDDGETGLGGYAAGAGQALQHTDSIAAWILAVVLSPFMLAAEAVLGGILLWAIRKRSRGRSNEDNGT